MGRAGRLRLARQGPGPAGSSGEQVQWEGVSMGVVRTPCSAGGEQLCVQAGGLKWQGQGPLR